MAKRMRRPTKSREGPCFNRRHQRLAQDLEDTEFTDDSDPVYRSSMALRAALAVALQASTLTGVRAVRAVAQRRTAKVNRTSVGSSQKSRLRYTKTYRGSRPGGGFHIRDAAHRVFWGRRF